MQEKIRAVVLGELRSHGAHDAQLVGHRANVWENVADSEATLTVSLECPWRLERGANIVELSRVNLRRKRFAMILIDRGLGSKESTCDTPPSI
jgi:hypothetical protein